MIRRNSSWGILTFLVVASILVACGAYYFVESGIYRASELGARVLNGLVILAILGWGMVTWLVRRLTVGKLPKLPMNSPVVFVFGIFRLVLLVAIVLSGISWLVALAFGLNGDQAFPEAFVLLVVSAALSGIIGGGIINLMLALNLIQTLRPVDTSQIESDLQL